MPSVTRTVLIQAPPAVVWGQIASQAALRRWFSPDIEIDLRVGGVFALTGEGGGTRITGSVLDLVPETRLALSWMEEGSGWLHPARLVIELAPCEAGTRVVLVHDGFAGIGKPSWEQTQSAYERGADRHRILERLARRAVEAHAAVH